MCFSNFFVTFISSFHKRLISINFFTLLSSFLFPPAAIYHCASIFSVSGSGYNGGFESKQLIFRKFCIADCFELTTTWGLLGFNEKLERGGKRKNQMKKLWTLSLISFFPKHASRTKLRDVIDSTRHQNRQHTNNSTVDHHHQCCYCPCRRSWTAIFSGLRGEQRYKAD